MLKTSERRWAGIIVVLASIWIISGCASTETGAGNDSKPIALVNGLLIDGTGQEPVQNAVIIVQGNRIVSVGSSDSVVIPKDAEVIDLTGSAVMPGVINTHVHYAYNSETLKAFAQAGVTTVRDMSDSSMERMKSWSWFDDRDELRKSPFHSRLLAVGPMLTVEDGYPIYMNKFMEPDEVTEHALLVDSIEHAREVTQRLIDAGADQIKISIENGITYWTPQTLGFELPALSPEEVQAIVSVAHANGVKVSAHITHSGDIPRFLAAGGDEIAHMVLDDGLSDDLIQDIVDAGVIWGPTLELWAYVEQIPFLLELDPNYQSLAPAVSNLRKFIQAGGKVALGTDFGGMPGNSVPFQYMPIIEMKAMMSAGMSSMDVIVAATKTAAEACNLETELGTLESGKIADILVVQGNPLEDIQVLGRPDLVMLNGLIIRRQQ